MKLRTLIKRSSRVIDIRCRDSGVGGRAGECVGEGVEGVDVTWNHGVKHFGCKECGVVVPYRYAKKNPIQFCCLGCAKLLVDKAYSRFY